MRPRLRFIGLVTAACALLVSSAGAQQVTGRVMDDRTGQPIAAVQVFIADTGIGALTQQNGRYLLLNVPAGTHTLSVQRIGFGTQTQEITVAAGETVVLDFQLREQALAMDEIVITGVPGGNRRRAVGNVVSTLDAAALQEIVPIDKVGNILAGRTAGVNMTSVDGQVGSGSMIRVRGESTLSLPPNPLIYIDGVRVENAETTGPNESRISRLDDISPEEIESIEVLRGPSAATLYGTEASQGVVNIITKRGIAGAPQVNVSVRQGISTYIRPENIFPTNYWTHPDGTVIPFNMITDSPEGPTAFRDGHLSTYTASVSGGSEDLTYYLMGSYTDDEGQLKNNSNERFNTRLNLDMRPAGRPFDLGRPQLRQERHTTGHAVRRGPRVGSRSRGEPGGEPVPHAGPASVRLLSRMVELGGPPGSDGVCRLRSARDAIHRDLHGRAYAGQLAQQPGQHRLRCHG